MPGHDDKQSNKQQKQQHQKTEVRHIQQVVKKTEERHQLLQNEQDKKLREYQYESVQMKVQEKNGEQKAQQHNQYVDNLKEDETKQLYHKTALKPLESDKQKNENLQTAVLHKSQLKKTYTPQKVQTSKSHDSFDERLKCSLKQNKLFRVIFNHFCKQNNLTSIKNCLFQHKQKAMEEMSLNKWMVFCKQFEIYSKLCKIKNNMHQTRAAQGQLPLQTSQVRQLHGMKEAKQVQKILIAIFKNSNKNASKLGFQSFVIAISNIFHQFKYLYNQDEKGIELFLSEVLYCRDEKTCYKKLSHLKFTSTTPEIEYNKLPFTEGQLRTKAKAVLTKTKQNYESRAHTLSSKENKHNQSRKSTQFNLNPVLLQAKRSLNQMNSYSKRCYNYQLSLAKLNSKTQQYKRTQHQTQLISYFQTTKDAILDSYFTLQSGRKMSNIRF